METKAKQNGTVKRQTATVKKEVQNKLTSEAIVKTVASQKKVTVEKPVINLDDRIQKFEKLRGLATQRERLTETLNELTKFNYNQDGSSSFHIRDSRHLEFKTTNSNLIKLVTTHLQSTLEQRKAEIEQEIVQFEL
jgi:predicted patatin/cPLA2 family phospholipase|tara:strand:+ start:32945 stop:33352 length:408 start_codon:yes stop_codon:yes gene_type:complete